MEQEARGGQTADTSQVAPGGLGGWVGRYSPESCGERKYRVLGFREFVDKTEGQCNLECEEGKVPNIEYSCSL